jgi:hypothetical protein
MFIDHLGVFMSVRTIVPFSEPTRTKIYYCGPKTCAKNA